MLNVVETYCKLCTTKTPEKVRASFLIRDLQENNIFGRKLKIVECRMCGLRYLNPMPSPDSLHAIYDYDTYIDSTNNNLFLQEYFLEMAMTHCFGIEEVLEVGCGTGEFLSFLEKKGMRVTGVEFAESADRVKFNGKLYYGRIEDIDFRGEVFDLIFVLNVIEHLTDPLTALKKLRKTLKNDGILILRHPNSDLFFNIFYKTFIEIPKFLLFRIRKIMGRKSRFTIIGFQNQHLFYFNRKTVCRLLNKSGFSVEYFTTNDPYNKYRLRTSFKKGKYFEGIISFVRYAMSYFGLGSECIIVARSKIN